jgi:hypothetical protein
MSDDITKEQHSKRIHSKKTAVKRQVKIAKAHGVEVKEPHKFIKHHAMNCGIPNCVMCGNPRKIWKEKSIQEKKFDEIPLEE